MPFRLRSLHRLGHARRDEFNQRSCRPAGRYPCVRCGFQRAGGRFLSVTTQSFSLTNEGTATLNWNVISTGSWLTASPNSGALAAGGQSNLMVSLNSVANSLAAGIYNANVVITNQNGGTVSLLSTLLVGQPLLLNGGFETGDFTGWTQSGNTAYTLVTSNNLQFVHSGTYGAQLGPSGTLGYLSQILPTSGGQNYLLSLWLDSPNITGTLTPNEFSVSWNGNKIFDQTNIGKIGWTNLQFIVKATGAVTALQLGFRDDPYYLGLDDIYRNAGSSAGVPGCNQHSRHFQSYLGNNDGPGLSGAIQDQFASDQLD